MGVLLLAVALVFQPKNTAVTESWLELGLRTEYGSAEQVRALQRHVKAGAFDLIALAWRTKSVADRQSVLLWDAKQQLLYRIHVDRSGVQWEKWTGATKERILRADPADGFDLPSHVEGRGRVGLSKRARDFVRKHAGATFARAV